MLVYIYHEKWTGNNASNNDTYIAALVAKFSYSFDPIKRRLRYVSYIFNLVAKACIVGYKDNDALEVELN